MPVNQKNELKVWQRRDRNHQFRVWFTYLCGVAIFMYCWFTISESTTWYFVYDAPRIAADIGGRAWPPRWSYLSELWAPLWDTINVATLGTALALVFAVPVAVLAARNTTPNKTFLRPLALLIIVSSRSINSLIWQLSSEAISQDQ